MTKERMITKNGVSIFTESFGNKHQPAILLIAGATVSMLFWDEEFCHKLASRGYFVIRYDFRDVGKSTYYAPGTTPYDLIDLVDDAFAILDEYQIEKAHFVGMSLGGIVTQIAALKNPERVETLTLFSTIPWADPDVDVPEMDTRVLDFHASAAQVNWTLENEVVTYMLEGAQLMKGRKPFNQERAEKMIRNEFQRANNFISMFNHASLEGGEAYYGMLAKITQPCLIIHGTDDLICHYKNTALLLKELKNAELLNLEGTGHELHHEDWETIIDGIVRLTNK